jgi:hypothetical protein
LKTKRVSPHVLRHSTAMSLLHSGVDRSVIALWLGHESMDTTQIYFHANLELKKRHWPKPSHFKSGQAAIVRLTSSWRSCNHSNNLRAVTLKTDSIRSGIERTPSQLITAYPANQHETTGASIYARTRIGCTTGVA